MSNITLHCGQMKQKFCEEHLIYCNDSYKYCVDLDYSSVTFMGIKVLFFILFRCIEEICNSLQRYGKYFFRKSLIVVKQLILLIN